MLFLAAALVVCASAAELADLTEVSAGTAHFLNLVPVPFRVELDSGKLSDTLFYTRGFAYGSGGRDTQFPQNLGSLSGSVPGPVFRMNPGETLSITLRNWLGEDASCTETQTEFCNANTTNLHTHGLHVSASGPAGEHWNSPSSDSVFVEVLPHQQQLYEFTIPDYHAPGTHWYHPHNHHSTALQAGGGAAGMIIVNDPAGYLPAEYMNMPEKIIFVSYHSFGALQAISLDSDSTEDSTVKMLDAAETAMTAAGLSEGQYLVNGMRMPTVTMDGGVWYRVRMVFAAVLLEWDMHLTLLAGTGSCSVQLLAKDGIYLNTIPRAISHIPFYPGARADVAIKCTCSTASCTFGTNAEDSTYNIMTFTVGRTRSEARDLTPFTPRRPCYLADLTDSDVIVTADAATGETTHQLTLDGVNLQVQWDGNGMGMTYANTHTDEVPSMSDWPAMGELEAGQVYEFEVSGAGFHPLHIHVNPFQITSFSSGEESYNDGYFQVGDWHDTLQISEMLGQTVTLRMQTDRFTGHMIVHCHILNHEDSGMMNFLDVVGKENAVWSCAKHWDTKCYDGPYTSRFTEHSEDATCSSSYVPPSSSPPPSSRPRVAADSSSIWLIVSGVVLAAAALGVVGFLALGRGRGAQETTELTEVIA